MFDWLWNILDDIGRLPAEIKQYNDTYEGVGKTNRWACFVLLIISAALFYYEYVVLMWLSLFMAVVSMFWNSEVATMLLKMAKYLCGSLLVGAAIGWMANLFGFDFMQIFSGLTCFCFFASCWWFGVD